MKETSENTCFYFMTVSSGVCIQITIWWEIHLARIILACDFPQSSFKLRRGILPLLTKNVS